LTTDNNSNGKGGGSWSTEPLGGTTIFSGAAPRTRPARFRSLTLVGTSPGRFGDGEPSGTLKIRLARMFEDRRPEVMRRRPHESAVSLPGQRRDPNLYTFLAHNDGKFIGSLSVRLDSTGGLAADDLYRDETGTLREAGAKVCEFLNLSIDVNSAPKRALACLFHAAYLFAGAVWAFDYGVIEVSTRHVDVFRYGLGFEPIGEERVNPRASAQEVLLCVHLKAALDQLLTLGGRPDIAAQETTLFPYGFSPEESAGVVRRLAELAASTLR
jgi:hypothetical protein